MRLTDEQEKVITAPLDQNINVIATAGAGKTTVMTYRISYMLKHYKIHPGNIAMFTYNVSLGGNMSNKLKKLGVNTEELFWCEPYTLFVIKVLKIIQTLDHGLIDFNTET